MLRRFTLTLLAGLAFPAVLSAAEYISVRGSAVVARVIDAVSADLRRELEVEVRAATDGSSTEAIYQVSNGVVDIAVSARMMAAEEKASRPDKRFIETVIGRQAIVVIVPDEVWQGGVRALSKDQFRAIYEREIKNWKEVGGPNRAITFFNRESTHGVWDLYMIYLYEDVRKAPLSKSEVIDNAEETKTAVQFASGSYSLLEFGAYEPGKGVHALGLKQADGTIVEPTIANIAQGRYEIARPLVMITSRQPTGKLREVIEYMTAEKGQEAVRKTGGVAEADLEKERKK